MSAAAPLTARPTEGFCNVPLVFHIESGRYGDVALDGLNVFVILHAPGVMADGNWSAATYIDEHADNVQTEALAAIFSGAAGGPMAAFTPLIRMSGLRMIPAGMGMMAPAVAPWSAFVFVMWAVMMVGMMAPSAAPVILMYARVSRQGKVAGKPLAATSWFAAGHRRQRHRVPHSVKTKSRLYARLHPLRLWRIRQEYIQ
jgi:hypothetical protein